MKNVFYLFIVITVFTTWSCGVKRVDDSTNTYQIETVEGENVALRNQLRGERQFRRERHRNRHKHRCCLHK